MTEFLGPPQTTNSAFAIIYKLYIYVYIIYAYVYLNIYIYMYIFIYIFTIYIYIYIMCPPGYYQSANGPMVSHGLGYMINNDI